MATMEFGLGNSRENRTDLIIKYPSSHPDPAINCITSGHAPGYWAQWWPSERYVNVLIPGTYDYLRKAGECILPYIVEDVVKNLERKSVSWVIQVGPKCNHTHPCKRETEEVLRHKRKKQWDHGSRSGRDVAMEFGQPPEAGRSERTAFCCSNPPRLRWFVTRAPGS